MQVRGGGGEGNEEHLLKQVLFQDDRQVLELGWGGVCTTMGMHGMPLRPSL